MVAAAVVGGAVVSGVASNMAANKQASAANNAADSQSQAAAQMRTDLAPYSSLGQQAINPLWSALGYTQKQSGPDNALVAQKQAQLKNYIDWTTNTRPDLDRGAVQAQINAYQQELQDAQNGGQGGSSAMQADPNSILQQQFQFNPSDLENTPGYQFTYQQGLRGVQNQLSSQGLGLSGAQIKGAEGFATGLANQTYGDQYNRALSTFNTNYSSAANNANRLMNVVGMGQNSAAQQGQASVTGANNAGNYQTQAANAQASGIMGTANAANNGVGNYLTYNALYGK